MPPIISKPLHFVFRYVTMVLLSGILLAVVWLTLRADTSIINLPIAPAIYYGWITPTLGFTPSVGTSVTAFINDQLCGQTDVMSQSGKLSYSIRVTAENQFAPFNDCGTTALTVTFQVGTWRMDHDRQWDNSQAWYHPLSQRSLLPVSSEAAISVLGSNIQLSWDSNTNNSSYEIHRSATPYFLPTAQTLIASLSAGSSTYLDSGAAGTPNTQYFYTVRALGATGQVVDSNQVGAINYRLNNTGSKYSLIALPLPSPTISNAATMAAAIGNVGALLKWNPATQTFRFFVPPSSGDNFSVAPGDAVFVLITAGGPSIKTMTGNVAPIQFSLRRGGFNFISLPAQKAALVNASGVAAEIGGVTAMLAWNEQTQLFRFFAPPSSGDNFAVKVGTPFIVNLSGSGTITWP